MVFGDLLFNFDLLVGLCLLIGGLCLVIGWLFYWFVGYRLLFWVFIGGLGCFG